MTFRIVNPDSVAKLWSDIKVRYYFTPTAQAVPNAVTDFVQTQALKGMLTFTATTEYAEVGFMTGAGHAGRVRHHHRKRPRSSSASTTSRRPSGTGRLYRRLVRHVACVGGPSQTYVDRPKMTAYYQGQLAWGTEP